MRTLFVVVGVLVTLLLLFSGGVLQGDVCLRHVGCAHGNSAGFSVDQQFPTSVTSSGISTPASATTP
jgi:hypothetical protein